MSKKSHMSSSGSTSPSMKQKHACVHVISRFCCPKTGDEESFSQILDRYPSLRTHARHGDILENCKESGYRSQGWSMLAMTSDPSSSSPKSLVKGAIDENDESGENSTTAVTFVKEEELDVDHGDDYGMPSLLFVTMVDFPLDYWDVDKMRCLIHNERRVVPTDAVAAAATVPPPAPIEGKFNGYWHSDETVVLVDVPKVFNFAPNDYPDKMSSKTMEDLGNGYDRLLRDIQEEQRQSALIVKRNELKEMLSQTRYICCEPLSEELRISLCPDVEKGWAAQIHDSYLTSGDREHLSKRRRHGNG